MLYGVKFISSHHQSGFWSSIFLNTKMKIWLYRRIPLVKSLIDVFILWFVFGQENYGCLQLTIDIDGHDQFDIDCPYFHDLIWFITISFFYFYLILIFYLDFSRISISQSHIFLVLLVFPLHKPWFFFKTLYYLISQTQAIFLNLDLD